SGGFRCLDLCPPGLSSQATAEILPTNPLRCGPSPQQARPGGGARLHHLKHHPNMRTASSGSLCRHSETGKDHPQSDFGQLYMAHQLAKTANTDLNTIVSDFKSGKAWSTIAPREKRQDRSDCERRARG